jgi:hypothetical protein
MPGSDKFNMALPYRSFNIRYIFEHTFEKSASVRSTQHLNRKGYTPCFYKSFGTFSGNQAIIFPLVIADNREANADWRTFESIQETLTQSQPYFEAEKIDIKKSDLLFAVAENGPRFGRIPLLGAFTPAREHFVTLHYSPDTQTATLIDARAHIHGGLYDTSPLEASLTAGLSALGLPLEKFNIEYIAIQDDLISCGAFTAFFIEQLAHHHVSIHQMKTGLWAHLNISDIAENFRRRVNHQAPDIAFNAHQLVAQCLSNKAVLVKAIIDRAGIKFKAPSGSAIALKHLTPPLSPDNFNTLLLEIKSKYQYAPTADNPIPKPAAKANIHTGYYIHDPARFNGRLQDDFTPEALTQMGVLKVMLYAAIMFYVETNSGIMEIAAQAVHAPGLSDSMQGEIQLQISIQVSVLMRQLNTIVKSAIDDDLKKSDGLITELVDLVDDVEALTAAPQPYTLGITSLFSRALSGHFLFFRSPFNNSPEVLPPAGPTI